MYTRGPRPSLLLALLAFPLASAGCAGPTCESTCDKLFQTDQCNIEQPGVSQADERDACVSACESALDTPGDIDDYNPNERSSDRSRVLQNDQEAAAWMECVSTTACEFLDDGYCAPVSF